MARGGRGRSGGGPPSSADPLAAIRDAVPGVGDDDIRAALDDAGGDVNAATAALIESE